ncbi:hypothetical protein TWF481_006078 [Arthrobotrys musiformis]|uniref:Uncharacterized protein n=1 Tax=Arthrobotrys musiformis TaxID=47236 RepID=A0AAV9WFU3_9PEZI
MSVTQTVCSRFETKCWIHVKRSHESSWSRKRHGLPMTGVDLVKAVNKNREDKTNPYLNAVHQLNGYLEETLSEKAQIIRLHPSAHISSIIPRAVVGKGKNLSAQSLRIHLKDAIRGGHFAYTAHGTIASSDTNPASGATVIVKIYDLYSLRAAERFSK